VLENEELFAAACDTPQNHSMPELTNLWDGPQGHLITSFEAVNIDVDNGGSLQNHVLAPAPGSHPRQGSVQWLKWRESKFLLLLQPIIDWNQTGLLSQIGDRVENQSNILQCCLYR
jgi:hypothetical protein